MTQTHTNTVPVVGDIVSLTTTTTPTERLWRVEVVVARGHLGQIVAHLSEVSGCGQLFNIPVSILTILPERPPMNTPAPKDLPYPPSRAFPSATGAALSAMQAQIGAGNTARGFHEEGDALREATSAGDAPASALRNYYLAKLALVVTEAAEAIEELRNGHDVNETYYPTSGNGDRFTNDVDDAQSFATADSVTPVVVTQHKPEGVPSEVADIVIRCFDFADEAGIDLAGMVEEKLSFNNTRTRLHGKTF